MRKTVCTASIFLVMLSALAASVLIRVADKVWWSTVLTSHGDTPLFVWILPNVILPIIATFASAILLYGIWEIAEKVCGKLRGDTK